MAWDREKERKAGKAMGVGMSVFALIFSVFWCLMACSMGAYFMLLFGIPFVGMMGYRLYVLLQMTKEEPKQHQADPWERPAAPRFEENRNTDGFCPYCGGTVEAAFEFCPKCGRRLRS